jgi:hypothetical protein
MRRRVLNSYSSLNNIRTFLLAAHASLSGALTRDIWTSPLRFDSAQRTPFCSLSGV